MKIKNKKTGALISIPEHLQEDVKKIIAMGGDPMTVLESENTPIAKDGGYLPLAQDGERLSQTPMGYNWNTPYSQQGLQPIEQTSGYKVELPTQDSYNIDLGKVGKTSSPKRKLVNGDVKFKTPHFYPLVGNRYLQEAVMDFNDAGTFASNIGKQPKDVKLPPPNYNQYVNMYYTEHGGAIPKAQWGIEQPKITPSAPSLTQGLQEIQLGQNTTSTPQGSNPWITAGAIAGTVAKVGSGVTKSIKGGLDIAGTNLANKKTQTLENQLYTQSVFSDGMNVPPYETQGYGFQGRNALAENGMQIKEIGGNGEPNIEVEGSEHIQLPNGFSQEIQGKSHAQGGEQLNLPEGTKIFSEKLKIDFGKTKKSYADLAKKFETKKNVDNLNSKFGDDIQKTTAEMMIKLKNQKLDELFDLQEINKKQGVHGKQVQNNALKDDMSMAQDGTKIKKFKLKDKEVDAKLAEKIPAGYSLIPEYKNLYGRTIEKTIPGTQEVVSYKKRTPVVTEAWKKATPEQRKKMSEAAQAKWEADPNNKIVTQQAIAPTIEKAEDYLYVEPNIPQPTQIVQNINRTTELPSMGIGLGLPNSYERLPLNYYQIEPQYIDPRYLDIQPELNTIERGQRAFQNNLGSRGATDISNLLQSQINATGAKQQAYGQKYNYDRQQDAQAQQFNAQAKMNANQYNQQSWFNQLEDPIRRREGIIGTQKNMDAQAAIENARKMQAFYGNKDFIGKTFYPAQGWTAQDILAGFNSPLKQYIKDAVKESKEEIAAEKPKKYGGKVKKKIKIKMKLRK